MFHEQPSTSGLRNQREGSATVSSGLSLQELREQVSQLVEHYHSKSNQLDPDSLREHGEQLVRNLLLGSLESEDPQYAGSPCIPESFKLITHLTAELELSSESLSSILNSVLTEDLMFGESRSLLVRNSERPSDHEVCYRLSKIHESFPGLINSWIEVNAERVQTCFERNLLEAERLANGLLSFLPFTNYEVSLALDPCCQLYRLVADKSVFADTISGALERNDSESIFARLLQERLLPPQDDSIFSS